MSLKLHIPSLPSRLPEADTQNQFKAQTSYNMVFVKCLLKGFSKHKDTQHNISTAVKYIEPHQPTLFGSMWNRPDHEQTPSPHIALRAYMFLTVLEFVHRSRDIHWRDYWRPCEQIICLCCVRQSVGGLTSHSNWMFVIEVKGIVWGNAYSLSCQELDVCLCEYSQQRISLA